MNPIVCEIFHINICEASHFMLFTIHEIFSFVCVQFVKNFTNLKYKKQALLSEVVLVPLC